MNNTAELIGVKTEEQADPQKKIKYFPTVPQMLFEKGVFFNEFDKQTQNLLLLLHNEFYCRYSEILHSTGIGLAWLTAPYFDLNFSEESRLLMSSEARIVSIICLLIFISEMIIHKPFNLSVEINQLWQYFTCSAPVYRRIYEIKYQHHFSSKV